MIFCRSGGVAVRLFLLVGLLLFLISQEVEADDQIRETQQILRNLGYDPGPIDGAWGGRTSAALEAYAKDASIEFNGSLTPEFYAFLVENHAALLTGRRHLERALQYTPVSLFPLENEACSGRWVHANDAPNYFLVVDRDIHGTTRIGGFIEAMGHALSTHLAQRSRETSRYRDGRSDEKFKRFLAHLEQAATEDAFTRVQFSGRSGPNPAHWVSALLNNLAYFVNYSDRLELWRDQEHRSVIIDWGNRLYSTSHLVSGPGSGRATKSYRWPDTAGMQVLSYVNWGLAAQNLDALTEGVEDWLVLLAFLDSDGAMRTFLNGGQWQNVAGPENNDFYYDNTLGFMVLAAVSARAAGVDLFLQTHNGANLHDAVRWRLDYVADWQSLDRLKKEPLYDAYQGKRRYWQANSFGGNWGWTEAYNYAFGQSELGKALREQNSKQIAEDIYTSAAMGPASCLYGLYR